MKNKVVSISKLVWKDGQFQFEKKMIQRVWDSDQQVWRDRDEQVTYETLESHGLTKEVSFDAIFAKEAENWVGLGQPPTNFFLQKVRISIPKAMEYKNYWLKLNESNQVICSVLPSHAFEVDFTSSFVKIIGKAKRISKKKARELLEAKSVYPKVLKKFGDGYRVIAYDVRL